MGLFVTLNVSLSANILLGLSLSVFTFGRVTTIWGNDIKTVVGLDAKVVDFACDVKLVDLSTKAADIKKDMLAGKKSGLTANQTGMEAEAVAALKLTM
jgi:hypothetical protein